MFEKEAEEILNEHCDCELLSECLEGIRTRCSDFEEQKKLLLEGIKFGYNKAMKEWRGCFMSCSSPYCGDKFRDIQCNGMLGNMTKTVKENDPDKLTDDVMNDWKEMEDVENDSSL